MSRITTAHIGYGFSWTMNAMPDRRILEIFNEDELENFLDLDRHLELDWDSYDIMDFVDFQNMMEQALVRLSGEAKPPVTMMIAGEYGEGIFQRVIFVTRESEVHAMLNEVVEVPPLEEKSNMLLNLLVEKYFHGAELRWNLWGYTT